MKKLQAFVCAFVLFVVFAIALNAVVDNVDFTQPGFSTWYNAAKDRCAPALSANIDDTTMLVMGSSEFNHQKKSKYHIKNMFSKEDMDVLLIGQPYAQSLSHAITLASLAPDMKGKKKVMLLLSPTWFKNEGVKPEAFASRFSDSAYVGMLTNTDIPLATRQAMAERAAELLKDNKDLSKRVNLYNNAVFGKNPGRLRLFEAFFTGWLQSERERSQLSAEVKLNQKVLKKAPGSSQDETVGDSDEMPDWKTWDAMWDEADRDTADDHDNPLNMDERTWEEKFKDKYLTSGNLHRNTRLDGPNEYADLRLFLSVAKAEKLDVEIVILPVNGYWYDYTSLGKSQREYLSDEVAKITSEFGVKLADLSDYSYEPGLLTDAVHPWQKGWVLLDETIFSFYKDEEPAD